jgi:hypothetical protein
MEPLTRPNWSLFRKILFRFFFIYLLLEAAPWSWLEPIPGVGFLLNYYNQFIDWMVQIANAKLFHIRKVLVSPAGSGDTSWSWALQWLYIVVAFAGCLIWSFFDRKRKNYIELNYWLCLTVRYYVIMIAFSYGLSKVFPLQMPFPNQSQLATPLGDFLPMRLSWMFMGYSGAYQIFSGFMEVLAGSLLLYRKTATMGALLALAVFSNVMMMNLSYDIPVKIFSMNIVLFCLYLLANEYNRILSFFVLNKPAVLSSIYHFTYTKRWMRITRVILKIAFIAYTVVFSFYENRREYKSLVNTPDTKPIKSGIYDIATFVVNKDTIPPLITDSMRWQDVVFEKNGSGSIKTADTIFRQRYKRGYFRFETDTLEHVINFKKLQTDSAMYSGIILSMRYDLPDTSTIRLWGKDKNDSLYVLLKRSDRHFQLAEKQFHWLSEYNR